jgi:hypothetical protein
MSLLWMSLKPTTALIVAIIMATAVMVAWGDIISAAAWGGASHGRAQAAAEIRRARDAVVGNITDRMRRRLAAAREKGPLRSALWWGIAGARAAKAVRRAMRDLRDGAAGNVLPAAGPLRRILHAILGGAGAEARRARKERKARKAQAPRWRDRLRLGGNLLGGFSLFILGLLANVAAYGRKRRGGTVPVGVCDNCGKRVSVMALTPVVRPGPAGDTVWLLCGHCYLMTIAPASDPEPERPAIALPPPAALPAPELVPAGGTPVSGQPAATNGELVATREVARRAATGALEGRILPPGGALARGGGDTATHGDYQRYSHVIPEAAGGLLRCQEAVLGALTAVDGSRAQIEDIKGWCESVAALAAHFRQSLAQVDAKILPLIDRINAEGGPENIAAPRYYRNV